MSQERKEKLIQEIEKAFADIEYPGDDRLVYPLTQADDWKLLNDFKGKHCKEIPPDILVKHVYDLPLLSPEGFRFYLPAYLLAAFRGEPIGDFWEFTFYSLVPPEAEGSEMDEFVNKIKGFNTQQRVLLKEFVELFIETEPFVDGALKERARVFWENE